jgi:hypothetical protein
MSKNQNRSKMMSKEERQSFIDDTDAVADQLMDILEPLDIGVSHLAATKVLCYILDTAAKADKALSVKFTNFSTQAINHVFQMSKPGEEKTVEQQS